MAALNDIQLRIVVQGTGIDNVSKLSGTLGNLNTSLGNTNKSLDQSQGKWSQFGKSLGDIERGLDAVFRAASHLQALGGELTGMGEAGLGFLRESVTAWGDYEFAVHRAAGALGIFDTTTPIFKNLQQAIDEVAIEARLFPAEEIARAVYLWGSTTGQTVKTQEDLAVVTKGLIPIMQAAAVTETDYEKAIKGVYQIIVQYNLGLGSTADVTQKLMLLTQKTALEFPDLIEAFKYTGTLAPELGVKFEDLAILMGRVGDMGIRGSMSGRALGQMFSKLVAPTVQAKKRLDEVFEATFGVNKGFDEMVFPGGKFIGLAEYVDVLADALEGLTEQERNQIIAIMTTQNEMRVMVPLINEQIRARAGLNGAIDMNKYSLENASETFAKTVHLLEQSWVGTLGLVSNTIGPIFRLIGSAVAEMATPALEAFSKMMIALREWLDTHPQIVEWGVKLIAVGAIIAIVAGTLFTVIGVVLAFGAGLVFVGKAAMSFVGIFTGFLPVLGGITMLVAGLAAAFYTNFGGMRDAIINVIDSLVNLASKLNFGRGNAGMLSDLAEIILPALEMAAKGVSAVLNGLAWAIDRISESEHALVVVQTLLNILLGYMALRTAAKVFDIGLNMLSMGKQAGTASRFVSMLARNLVKVGTTTIGSGPRAGLHTLIETLKAAGGYVVGFIAKWSGMNLIASTASRVAPIVAGALRLMLGPIGIIISAVALLATAWINNWGDIQGKFAAVAEWIGQTFDNIKGFFDGVQNWLGMFWTAIQMRAYHAINNFISFWQELPGRIGQFVSEMVTNITTWFSTLWTNISTWVGNIVTTIVEFPGKVLDQLVTGFNNIMTWIGEWWNSLGEDNVERAFYLATRIALFPVTLLIELVKGFVTIWNWFVEWWENLTEATGNWISGVVTTVVDWISQLPGHVANWFGQVWNNFVTWWENLMDQTGKWISSVVNTIVDWISKLPGRFADWFRQVWNNVSTWFTNFIAAAGLWASQTIDAIINWIKLLPGRVMDWFRSLFTNVSRWFTNDFVPNIGVWTNNAITAVVNFFRELPGRVMKVVDNLTVLARSFLLALPGNIWNAIVSVGTGIVDGIRQGLINAWESFRKFVHSMFTGIVNGVKDALGIASPSKVFAEIGTEMVAGVAVGIANNNSALHEMWSQVHALEAAARTADLAIDSMGSGNGYEFDGTRRLIVEHHVSSPDGTVNQASQEQLEDIFGAEEFVTALEHMATVG